MERGKIVILNGAPRSGKSSIVMAVQENLESVWINLGVDNYMKAIPGQYQPGIGLRPGGERPDLEPMVASLYEALYAAIAAHSERGVPVVVDVGHHDGYSRPLGILPACARILAGYPVLFVGVRCPLEEIVRRREATGYPARGVDGEVLPPILHWQEMVHQPGIYDMEVDTSVEPAAVCAQRIAARLESGPLGGAFAQLAGM